MSTSHGSDPSFTPCELDTITSRPPVTGSEITAHYYSYRSDSLNSRSGTLIRYVKEDDGRVIGLVSNESKEEATFIGFSQATVYSYTGIQTTKLGPLVAVESEDQPLDTTVSVKTPPAGHVYLYTDPSCVVFADEFDERVALDESELKSAITDAEDDGTTWISDGFETHIPVSYENLLRGLGRLQLAKDE